MLKSKSASILALTAVLTACGGGGSNSSSNSTSNEGNSTPADTDTNIPTTPEVCSICSPRIGGMPETSLYYLDTGIGGTLANSEQSFTFRGLLTPHGQLWLYSNGIDSITGETHNDPLQMVADLRSNGETTLVGDLYLYETPEDD